MLNVVSSGTYGLQVDISTSAYDIFSGFWGIEALPSSYINSEISTYYWSHETPNVGGFMTNNFTFYNNGTVTVNITVGINNTNYSYVNYSAWLSNGHDQYTANFTIDGWSSETNIEPKVAGQPVTIIYNNLLGGSDFNFGIKIYMPKSVTFVGIKEDYKIMFNATGID
jgi:hypothetical protein